MPTPLLFVDHATGLGGAEHSLLMLLQNLNRQKYAPHLACTQGGLHDAAQSLNIPVHPLSFPALRHSPRVFLDWRKVSSHLRRIAEHMQAAVIISNTVRSSLYASLAARLARRPFIWYMRDFWLSEMRPQHLILDRILKRLLYATATRVIANSRATAAHLPPGSKTTVIHNGIELSRFNPSLDGQAFRKTYAIPAGVPLVGTVGRLRPWKGQERFLRVVALIKQQIPTLYAVVVGGNPLGDVDTYSTSLQQLSETLGIRDHVVFTGQIPNPQSAMAAMDVFVHPGAPEPFGLVNVEAMAMAKPVVAFAHGALSEIVVENETGCLVSPVDEEAMAAAITELLMHPEQRIAMGERGRIRAQAQFSVRRTACELGTVLDEIIFSKVK